MALPWMKKKGEKNTFLEEGVSTSKCQTFSDILKSTVEKVLRDLLKRAAQQAPASASFPSHGPAPALPPQLASAPGAPAHLVPLPPQAFLQRSLQAPAPAPGPAAAPSAPRTGVGIFVAFKVGKAIEGGKSTIVEVTFTDTPKNGVDDVAMAESLVKGAVDSGAFHKVVQEALHVATCIKPKLGAVKVEKALIKQWDVHKCEGHVSGIAQRFAKHYTPDQVPMALYNECTNFMTKISFSNDHVLDPLDTLACKKTTARFAKRWDEGKVKDEVFENMCVRACEAKFGKGAPQCNIQALLPS